MGEPPMRLVLGKFARQYVKEGYEESLAELERWSDLTLSTEHDDAKDRPLPRTSLDNRSTSLTTATGDIH
jgi:hypothetical protein